MHLIQMIYASAMLPTYTPEEIGRILESARRHNGANQITGFLCFANGYFLQILEGDRQAVSETFCRIAQDPRHYGVVILDCSPIPARRFADWGMGYAGETRANRTRFFQVSVNDVFDPVGMSRESAHHLLVTLASELKISNHVLAA